MKASAAFAARSDHQVVAHPVSFKYGVTPILVAIPEDPVRVPAYLTPPVTVMTLTASGGAGGFRFEEAADARGVVSVAADGALVATAFVRGVATVSIRVTDAEPVNVATVAVTMTFVFSLSLSVGAAEYVVSPGYTGAVHSLAASSGYGDFAYARVAGTTALTVGADGVVSLTMGLTTGALATAVFAIMDEIGGVGAVYAGLAGGGGRGLYGLVVCRRGRRFRGEPFGGCVAVDGWDDLGAGARRREGVAGAALSSDGFVSGKPLGVWGR